MSTPARFLFDECLGKPLMEAIRQTTSSDATFVHICDYLSQGVKDADWIPRLATEGDWVVITADGGKQSKRGHKLPDLCHEHRITHIVLSSSLHKKTAREKADAIVEMWPQIVATREARSGTRFQLRYQNVKGGGKVQRVKLTLVEILLPPATDPESKPS